MSTERQTELMRLIRINVFLPACRWIPKDGGFCCFFFFFSSLVSATHSLRLSFSSHKKKKKQTQDLLQRRLCSATAFCHISAFECKSRVVSSGPAPCSPSLCPAILPPFFSHHAALVICWVVRKFLTPGVTCFVIWILWWWRN